VNERFCDVGRGITLCYETFGSASDPTALLIMGLGTQMVAWHEDFCRQLAERGLHVVRFDNRDIGRSTHVEGRPPTIREMLARSGRSARYSLADMADDASELLRRLELAPAHVIGASMGGMIAQTLAARHPDDVRSLVSIMSSTGSRRSGQPSLRVYSVFLRRAPRERERFIDHMERVFAAIGSPGELSDASEVRTLAALSYDRDRDPSAAGRQLAAIMAAGDRSAEPRRPPAEDPRDGTRPPATAVAADHRRHRRPRGGDNGPGCEGAPTPADRPRADRRPAGIGPPLLPTPSWPAAGRAQALDRMQAPARKAALLQRLHPLEPVPGVARVGAAVRPGAAQRPQHPCLMAFDGPHPGRPQALTNSPSKDTCPGLLAPGGAGPTFPAPTYKS
jgi:pimeloyl-ACP methyl ester carboxylesterase